MEYSFLSASGEQVLAVITSTEHDKDNKNGLMNIWVKHGCLKEFIPETLCVQVYATDAEGNCRGKYNPTEKPSEDGKGRQINFEWMLPATPENEAKILEEIKNRAGAVSPAER